MSEIYDVDYFIRFFKSKPAKTWCEDLFQHNGKCCVFGHLGVTNACWSGLKPPRKAVKFCSLFGKEDANNPMYSPGYMKAVLINNQPTGKYQQKTPRARILRALQDIKNGKVAK